MNLAQALNAYPMSSAGACVIASRDPNLTHKATGRLASSESEPMPEFKSEPYYAPFPETEPKQRGAVVSCLPRTRPLQQTQRRLEEVAHTQNPPHPHCGCVWRHLLMPLRREPTGRLVPQLRRTPQRANPLRQREAHAPQQLGGIQPLRVGSLEGPQLTKGGQTLGRRQAGGQVAVRACSGRAERGVQDEPLLRHVASCHGSLGGVLHHELGLGSGHLVLPQLVVSRQVLGPRGAAAERRLVRLADGRQLRG